MNEKREEQNRESAEDGLSALKRLAALDRARGETSQPGEATEAIPDWLELLLAKYGEEASMLVGLASRPAGGPAGKEPFELFPAGDESTQVASLLEQMAAQSEEKTPADRPATSVDWGRAAERGDEGREEPEPSWLDRLSAATPGQAEPAAEEAPGWIDEVSHETVSPPGPAGEGEEVPDWLREATSGPPAEESEIPDWLKEMEVTPADAAPGGREEAPQPSEVPDWVESLGASAGQPQEAEPARPAGEEGEGEVPDWLARLAAVSGPAPETPLAERPAEQPAQAEAEEEIPDWLHELGTLEEVPPAEVEAEEEVPDWLRELEALEKTPEAELLPADAREEEEAPDLLAELEAAEEAPTAGPPVPETLEEPEEEIPDWLRELQPVEERPAAETRLREPEAPTPSKEEEEEVEPEAPDWLVSLRRTEVSTLAAVSEEELAEEEPEADQAAEEPDWLAALRSGAPQDVWSVEEELVEAEEEGLPDWLTELRASQETAEARVAEEIETEAPEEIPAPEEQPPIEFLPAEAGAAPEEPVPTAAEESGALAWLAEIEAAAQLEDLEQQPAPEAPAPELLEEEMPDWLRDMPPVEFAPEAEVLESEKETRETRRLPEWLVATPEEEGAIAEPAEGTPPEEEVLSPAAVPDWLMRLKPGEGELEEEEAEEDVLAGIPGLLPIAEAEIEEEESISALRARLGVPEVPDVEGARLFKEIAAEAAPGAAGEEQVEGEPRRRSIFEALTWALLFIVLIVAIALALMAVLNQVNNLPGGQEFRDFFGSARVIDPAPVNTFRAQVTRLPADAPVVVSFDYSLATEAEMGPLARAAVSDLLENEARLLAVSLRPEGAAMAQRLFADLAKENSAYPEQTVNLGYLPGQMAGVRSLAFLPSLPLFGSEKGTLADYAGWQDLGGLGDVALIVVISDSPLPVRWWVEQVGPGTRIDLPIIAAVSSSADPSVRPYYNHIDPMAGQLSGLVSGVSGAAAYENRLGEPGRAAQSLAAQSVAHLGVIVLGMGGTVVGFRAHAARNRE